MRTETVTLTNMCMVYDDAGNVLVQDKVDKKWSGLTFPGGHIEKGESFVDSVIREVFEETGLTIEKPRICGTKDWLRDDGSFGRRLLQDPAGGAGIRQAGKL